MKKLLLTLLAFFSIFAAKAQCDYNLDLNDSYGDGWATVTIDVKVDDVTVLSEVFASGSGTTYQIPVDDGSEITFVWNGTETWSTEVSWQIRDFLNDEVVASGNYQESPSGLIAICTEQSCASPADLADSGVTTSSVDLTWTAGGTESLWDIELVDITAGGSATGTPTTPNISTNPYTISGLTSGNNYEVYLRAVCGVGDVSFWSGPVSFTTIPACGDTVTFCYDSGSDALVLQTSAEVDSAGDYITATVNSGSTESGYDELVVYDSLDTSGSVLYDASGDHAGQSFESTTGFISVWVRADSSVSCVEGDESQISITFTCAAPPSCPDPSALTASGITTTSVDLDWTENGTATNYNVEVYESGADTTTATPVFTTSVSGVTTASVTGLTENTSYDGYVQASCGFTGISEFTSVTFTTECAAITIAFDEDFGADSATFC